MSTKNAKINSHVGIPKVLLKRFSVSGEVFVLNVINATIRKKGIKKATTEYGYYDQETEDLLNKELERSLGLFLIEQEKKINSVDSTNLINENHKLLELFFRYQLQRSKVAYNLISSEAKSGPFSHSELIKITKHIKSNMLSLLSGKLFGIILHTTGSHPLITNSLGFYPVLNNKGNIDYLIIPISDKNAIVIMSNFDGENPFSCFESNDETTMQLNEYCFIFEKQMGNGYLISKNDFALNHFKDYLSHISG